MITYEVTRDNVVNMSGLHHSLLGEMGDVFSGISQQQDIPVIQVHLLIDAPDDALEEQAKQVVTTFIDSQPAIPVAAAPNGDIVAELLRRIQSLEQKTEG